MKYSIKNLEDCKIELTVEVDADFWKKAQGKAFNKLAAGVSIPGFRKGKAPASMVASRIDPAQVVERAVNDSLNEIYGLALSENQIRPYYRPTVDVKSVTTEELTLVFGITTMPTVKLGAYKGFHADKEEAVVDDKEVEAAIQKRLEGAAELVVVEREAKLGDTLTLDFEGFIDGVAFDGGKADNYALELGSHSFVPGFEDALVGVKTGEERDVKVTFPEQYVAELAGKEATFHCVIHEIKEKRIPELTDEAVKDLEIKDVETVEALREHEKKTILESKTNEINRKHYEAIVKQIVDAAEVKMAAQLLDEETAGAEENTKRQIESNGLTFKQYLEIIGKDEETFRKELRESTLNNIKTSLVLQQIAIEEKLLVSDEEMEQELEKMATQYSMKLEDLKRALGGRLDGYRENLTNKKVQDFLLANND